MVTTIGVVITKIAIIAIVVIVLILLTEGPCAMNSSDGALRRILLDWYKQGHGMMLAK